MRKWLYLLLALAVVRLISGYRKDKEGKGPSRFRKIDRAITLFVWILSALYLAAIIYWYFGGTP